MNVVVAHVLKTAMTVAEEEETIALARSIITMFSSDFGIASTKVFSIDKKSFYRSFEKPPMQEFLRVLGIDANRALEFGLFELMDVDNSGVIDSDEIVASMLRLTGDAKA